MDCVGAAEAAEGVHACGAIEGEGGVDDEGQRGAGLAATIVGQHVVEGRRTDEIGIDLEADAVTTSQRDYAMS